MADKKDSRSISNDTVWVQIWIFKCNRFNYLISYRLFSGKIIKFTDFGAAGPVDRAGTVIFVVLHVEVGRIIFNYVFVEVFVYKLYGRP